VCAPLVIVDSAEFGMVGAAVDLNTESVIIVQVVASLRFATLHPWQVQIYTLEIRIFGLADVEVLQFLGWQNLTIPLQIHSPGRSIRTAECGHVHIDTDAKSVTKMFFCCPLGSTFLNLVDFNSLTP
jgi:hypothetical protein